MQRLGITSNTVGTGLITVDVTTGSLSIPAFANTLTLPIGVALSGMSILLPLANAASRKSRQLFAVKQEKHN